MILKLNESEFIRTDEPIDISLSLHGGDNPVLAWYCDPIKLEPVMTDRFIGEVKQGGSVNFRNLYMNPHAHGTHTECLGHISEEFYSINQFLKEFHFFGTLISVETSEVKNEDDGLMDHVITKENLQSALRGFEDALASSKVLIVRTIPNGEFKLTKNYSDSNPAYFTTECMHFINELGVDHLMVDLPSIDREIDGGALAGHHIFWEYPSNPQFHKTITELIYAAEQVKNGKYLVNIQITSLENDASPSKIVLYEIQQG